MATVTQLNTYMDAATSAIASGDWSTAETQLMAAWSCLLALPDAGQGNMNTRWDRASIQKLLDDVRDKITPSATDVSGSMGGGIQRTRVNYVGASSGQTVGGTDW